MGFEYLPRDVKPESYPINVEDLLTRCLGRLDLAERILQKFLDALDVDVRQLEAAVQASNVDEVAHLAHRIKGASLAVSAGQLTACARRLEDSATARRVEEFADQFESLKQESRRFQDLPALPVPAGSSP
jgi:HPt (histidine-containing phosphotransfer) domain-containing protein